MSDSPKKLLAGDDDLINAAARGDIESVTNFLQVSEEYERNIAPALVVAAKNGHALCVRLLITAGAVPNSVDECGCSALLRASSNGYPEIVDILLEAGADANLQCGFGATALIAACETGNIECAKRLLNVPHILIELRNDFGETPLYRAVTNSLGECLKFLINSTSADVNAIDMNGVTPLMVAAERNFTECVKILLEVPEIELNAVDRDGRTALYGAIENVNRESMEILLQTEGVDLDIVDCENRSHLDAACDSGDVNIVTRILESGVTITTARTNRSALMYMAAIGNMKFVLHLIRHGMSITWCDDENKNALYFAAANSQFGCLEVLVGALKETDKGEGGMKKLFLRSARMRGIFRSLSILFASNIFRWSWFPHYDCRVVRSLVQKILTHGIPPGLFQLDGLISSPLHHALMMRDLGQVKYLVANLYLTPYDVNSFHRDISMAQFISQTGSKPLRRLYRNLYKNPWRLETLALLKVSTLLKHDENRHTAVDNSVLDEYLPQQCLTRLSFRSSIRWLDVTKWDEIPVDGLHLQEPEVPGHQLVPHEILDVMMRPPRTLPLQIADAQDFNLAGLNVDDDDEEDEEEDDEEDEEENRCGENCVECYEQRLDENDFLIYD